MTTEQTVEFSRIIVRTPNWVGDAVMSLPFFAALRLNAPRAEIVALTRQELQPLFAQDPSIDRVITLHESSSRSSLATIWKGAEAIRAEHFELGFCLPPSFGSALIFWIGAVRRRIGHAADARRWLLTDPVAYGPNGQRPHRIDGYLSLLSPVWTESKRDRTPKFTPDSSTRQCVDARWWDHRISDSAALLAIAPGAAQPNKLWASAHFAQVARRWVDLCNGMVLIVGGPTDSSACASVLEEVREESIVNLCGAGNLPVVAEILRRCHLFVGNDSGLAHLAAAVGTPTVAISGPGDPAEVAPLAAHAVTVKKPLFCSPCYRNFCYRTDHPLECQDLVAVDDVWEAANTLRERLSGRLPAA